MDVSTVLAQGSHEGALAPVLVPVDEASRVGEARRAAAALAASLGFDESSQGRVALVATEAAGNLAKHAQQGVLIAQAAGPHDAPYVEIVTVDRGPGMADPARCLADGFSTAGTPGKGLGAIARTADLFELDSHPGRGSVLLAHVHARPIGGVSSHAAHAEPADVQVGAVCLPLAGERACGDAWLVLEEDGRTLLLVVDGLGHGEQAAVAAQAALATLCGRSIGAAAPAPVGLPSTGSVRAGPAGPAAAALSALHAALRPTRGAAVGVAVLEAGSETLRFAGIGNVAAVVVPDPAGDPSRTRGLVSQNGIVGHQARTPTEVAERCPPGALVILASDGVRPSWRLDAFPGLARRHPTIIAATLWRELARGRDDATVLVARLRDATRALP